MLGVHIIVVLLIFMGLLRALEIASKIGSAAAIRNPRAALSATPDLNKFANTGEGIKVLPKGRGLYLGTKER